ncbi:MAG: carboxypeptidase-like regulatory domain-containing protein [Acidobacteriota bacterium]|nr:carboxypeptidase-like regulatory domain-containing protein [Acidobacteriota bacterium]
MKKALQVFLTGCVLSSFSATPAVYELGSNHSFAVNAAVPALAVVSGTVKDERGAPLIGAVVAVIEPRNRGKELKRVSTDAKGRFSAGITPGVYRLRAFAEGFVPRVTNVFLDRTTHIKHDFQLKREDTLVQRRGDSDDYRWIARGAPRHAMNLTEETDDIVDLDAERALQADVAAQRTVIHGAAQFVAVGSASRSGIPASGFYGTNFAISGSFGHNFEMAVIGQRGVGQMAPQRLTAMATMRPSDRHQVTAAIGYGQTALARKLGQEPDVMANEPFDGSGALPINQHSQNSLRAGVADSLDQVSVSATVSSQVFQPLLLIYGFDYSRFVGSVANQRDSILPRFAIQYSPTSRLRMNAAITPGSDHQNLTPETFDTENLQASFATSPAEVAFGRSPILDRSQRFETGFERVFGEGNSSIEASAFYDMISGHGVGVLALPLESSPEMQQTFQQVANQVTAMNGAARGIRLMYNRRLSDHVTTSFGYSFGRGEQFNNDVSLGTITPGRLFRGGFFQVAAAKLDLDFTQRTGTRISTVIRLSPSAVVFAIDPFAGRMSVYDPNINIYVTQDLPNFGLPVRWQAIVDARNLLDQPTSVEDGSVQLIATRVRRSVRGGFAFRW